MAVSDLLHDLATMAATEPHLNSCVFLKSSSPPGVEFREWFFSKFMDASGNEPTSPFLCTIAISYYVQMLSVGEEIYSLTLSEVNIVQHTLVYSCLCFTSIFLIKPY